MVFSDTTNNQGLVQYVRKRTKADSGQFSEDLIRLYLNTALSKFSNLVIDAAGIWKFDATSNTDFPIITTDVVASQQDYTMDYTMLTIHMIEMQDTNGTWRKLRQLNENELGSLSRRSTVEALPNAYYLRDGAIWLDPVPDTNVTGGLKIYVDRKAKEFNGSATQIPGIPHTFHEWLGDFAAFKYATQESLQSKEDLRIDVDDGIKDIKNLIARRNKARVTRVIPKVTLSI